MLSTFDKEHGFLQTIQLRNIFPEPDVTGIRLMHAYNAQSAAKLRSKDFHPRLERRAMESDHLLTEEAQVGLGANLAAGYSYGDNTFDFGARLSLLWA